MKAGYGILAGLVMLLAVCASAHEMTEKYIPVGYYENLRSADTALGRITALDVGKRTVTLATDSGEWQYTLTDDTRVWLDRSHLKQTNLDGSFDDIRPGLEAEIHRASDAPERCVWIKLRVEP